MDKVTLENSYLALTVVPELGCKISSIYDKEHSYEWLWQDAYRPLKIANHGDSYEAYDISGFDECFPNIGISPYPGDPAKTLLDHGEIWSIPWEVHKSAKSLNCKVLGRQFNFVFKRIITLEERTLNFNYEITNLEDFDFYSLWSAHALFKVSGDMRLSLSGNPMMCKEFGFSERMSPNGADGYKGQFSEFKWPSTINEHGQRFDLSYISLSEPLMDKVVVEVCENIQAKLLDITTGRAATMEFSGSEIAYLGICYNLGAWPSGEHPARWIALEPTNGCTDKLTDSVDREAFIKLAKDESKQWSYSIEFN